MFDEDPAFRDRPVDDLLVLVEAASKSVVLRGRALLEIGRRATEQPALQQRLFEWAGDPNLAAKRWIGPVTLAWIAACGLGHAVPEQGDRARIAETLRAWPASERELLLKWTDRESWFRDIR